MYTRSHDAASYKNIYTVPTSIDLAFSSSRPSQCARHGLVDGVCISASLSLLTRVRRCMLSHARSRHVNDRHCASHTRDTSHRLTTAALQRDRPPVCLNTTLEAQRSAHVTCGSVCRGKESSCACRDPYTLCHLINKYNYKRMCTFLLSLCAICPMTDITTHTNNDANKNDHPSHTYCLHTHIHTHIRLYICICMQKDASTSSCVSMVDIICVTFVHMPLFNHE